MQGRNIIRIALVALAVLLVPLVAMQFTTEVNWSVADFVVMGTLLFAVGLALELVTQKITNQSHRTIAKIIIVLLFLLIWAELAVGVFGTPWAGS